MILKIVNILSVIFIVLGITCIVLGVYAVIVTDGESGVLWLLQVGGFGLAILFIGTVIKILLKIERNTRK